MELVFIVKMKKCCMNTQFKNMKKKMNFKIDETHTKKKNTIVICDLITTLDADDTTKTKREEEIPFKVTLMRCVSYKIQMVENKIQHELMNNLWFYLTLKF